MPKTKRARTRTPTDKRTDGPRDKGGEGPMFVPLADMVQQATSAPQASTHLRALAPIPDEASADPMGWADRALEALVPLAAKEKEWQLKFGTDAQRDKVASELLAMKGMGPKRDTAPQVNAVIQLMPFTNPFARVLPSLPQGPTPKTIEGTRVGVDEGTSATGEDDHA